MTVPILTELESVLAASASPAKRLQSALDLIGPHLGVDRCFLYVRDPAQARGRIAFVWRKDAAVPDPRHPWQDDTGDLPKEDPLFQAALAAQPSVYVEDVNQATPEVLNQDFERRTFGHRALVHAHITEHKQLWGILQPCTFDGPRAWTPANRDYLEGAAPLFLPGIQAYMGSLGKI
ncbi:putative GAF sensor protein [Hymenobacter roseosalivarius DSM 11622]|uniref:Putative GAF sensor protein n=1 Tax=Hymenobacter roseosalivarius DSM 11622 TaxID=645990 RepID=A0A1W1W062_9BACT|nr:GAF domain-containing protein [Hymenobacter roseosalivarius]SMB99022.1 putative GAF sensor protein [Hymenobacter roseosalivarius DSM 11622]